MIKFFYSKIPMKLFFKLIVLLSSISSTIIFSVYFSYLKSLLYLYELTQSYKELFQFNFDFIIIYINNNNKNF